MPKSLKANILATSDLNPLNIWSKLWTVILYHVQPAMTDDYKAPLFLLLY